MNIYKKKKPPVETGGVQVLVNHAYEASNNGKNIFSKNPFIDFDKILTSY